MLAIVISLFFGFVAFAALAQIYHAIRHGLHRGRRILAELSFHDRQEPSTVRATSARVAWRQAAAAA